MRRRVAWSALLGAALSCGSASHGRAQDAGAASPGADPGLMAEPIGFTQVADAFEDDDAFDIHVRVGFERSRTTGRIQRETARDGDGPASREHVAIADYEEVTHRLVLGLDVGLFHDLMLYSRLPLILSHDRVLQVPKGRTADEVAADLRTPASASGQAASTLFDVPKSSPTRSGVDWVSLGVAWGLFNQQRASHVPTWVLRAEGRFGIGTPLHPCVATEDGRRCGFGGGDPGMSRGTHALRLESRTSYRYRSFEPYLGFAFQAEWAAAAEAQLTPGEEVAGLSYSQPPRRAEVVVGSAWIPWEDRARHQRIAVDLRARGAYVGAGRDYTPLFDVLGASQSPYLTAPNFAAPGDPDAEEWPFTGVTDVEAHARLGVRAGVELQAARYVRFLMGMGLTYATPHLLSGSARCNAEVAATGDDPRRGGCGEGVINPAHRSVIDAPGRRFRLDGAFTLDLYINAVGQF